MNQYYCQKHVGVRVYPFSGLERQLRTLAPILVRNAEAALLTSYNGRADTKIAWCFVCRKFVPTETLDREGLRDLYLSRNVSYRRPKRRKFRLAS